MQYGSLYARGGVREGEWEGAAEVLHLKMVTRCVRKSRGFLVEGPASQDMKHGDATHPA